MNPDNEAKRTDEPTIEPPCEDCLSARAESGGTQQWCARHSEHHVHGHEYHYARELPLARHDGAVTPIGVDAPGRKP